MLDTQRAGGMAFIDVESVRAPSFVFDDRDADTMERQVVVETGASLVPNRMSMRNLILKDVRIRSGEDLWQSTRRLRITVETYDSPDVLAYLVDYPAFVGHGRNLDEALEDLLDEIEHDLRFYRDAEESDLTTDAVARVTLLRQLFEASSET